MGRWAARLGAVFGGAVVGVVAALAFSAIAYAHVHVNADPAVAGATGAVLTFDAAAESDSAGVESVRIVLPEGIAPSDVTLTDGPDDWTLTPGGDGYTVGGPALPVGQDAVHSVRVARLPDATELVFKALVNYTDGRVDRWIEEPSDANPDPANPAPVLELAPNPNPAAATTAPPTPPGTTPPATNPAATPEADAAPDDGGSGAGWVWWLVGAVVVIGAGVAAVVLRRRRPSA